jgi:hypothetical protein
LQRSEENKNDAEEQIKDFHRLKIEVDSFKWCSGETLKDLKKLKMAGSKIYD